MAKLIVVLACLFASAASQITNGGRYTLRFGPSLNDPVSSQTFIIRAEDKENSILYAPSISRPHPGDVFEFRAVPTAVWTWEITHETSGLFVHPKYDNASPDSPLWLRKDSYQWIVTPYGLDIYRIGLPLAGNQWILSNFQNTWNISQYFEQVKLEPNQPVPSFTSRQFITIAGA